MRGCGKLGQIVLLRPLRLSWRELLPRTCGTPLSHLEPLRLKSACHWPSNHGRLPQRRARRKRGWDGVPVASQRIPAAARAWAVRPGPERTGRAGPGRLRKSGCPRDFPTACTHYKGAIRRAARQEMSENGPAPRDLRRSGAFSGSSGALFGRLPLHWRTRLSTLPALFSAPQMRGRPRG